jgi:hypothetical protein
MKYIILFFCFLLFSSDKISAQKIQNLNFSQNTLTGKVILKTLLHPIKEIPIKNCLVFKLDKKVKFIAEADSDEADVVTDEIRIYGASNTEDKYVNPNIIYRNLINKRVTINAVIYFAPSGHYPLLANMSEIISYKIIGN